MDSQEEAIDENSEYVAEEEDAAQLEYDEVEIKDENYMFSTLCRFCTNPKGDDGIDIFGYDETSQEINEMINLVLPEKVSAEDGLTHFLCLECVDKLRQCYEILVVFVAADRYFKSQVAEYTEKEEYEDALVYEEATDSFYNNESIHDNNDTNFIVDDIKTLMEEDTSFKQLLQTQTLLDRKCNICLKRFSSFQSLVIHRRIIHKHCLATRRINHYQCQNCPRVYTSLQALQVHVKSKYLRERNQSNIHICKKCGLSFKRKYLLRAHNRETHKNHPCTLCGLNFLSLKALLVHTKSSHDETTCSVCGKKFKSSHWREVHEKTHESDNCHLCWVCGKVCASRSSLRTHVSLHYSSKSYACDVCGKELKSASGLKHHKQTHTDRERTFKCNICEKAFTSKVILKQHGLSHSGLKPFTCSNCGTQFNRLSNLNYHIKHYCSYKKHLKARNKKVVNPAYQCEVCQSTFISKLSFKYHMSRHTGNKTPFDCEECGLAFSSVSSFRQHKREHALIYRSYVCEACGKTFKNKASLATHSSSHSNLYPYNCTECNRSFKRISYLKIHQSVHSSGKPYRCGICLRSFSRQGDAKGHLSRCHKVDLVIKGDNDLGYKYSEVVLDPNNTEDFPVVAGEYVVQMADDVEIVTSCDTI